jgi:hypothetical protein
MENKITRQYTEHSTWDGYYDSTAFGYEELGNPWVIHFYKAYRKNISREQLTMYHRIHHYLSKKNIPALPIVWEYENTKYQNIKLHILDLDVDDIGIASNVDGHQVQYITHPEYIDGDPMRFRVGKRNCENIISHLVSWLYGQWIYIPGCDKDNFRIKEIDKWILHISVTDLASRLPMFCEDNIDRINQTIPDRNDRNIETRYDLMKTLAADEAIAKPRKKTTTQ